MISLEAVLLLVFALITSSSFFHGAWSSFIAAPGMLTLSLLAFLPFFVSIAGNRASVPAARRRFMALAMVYGVMLVMVGHWQIDARQEHASPAYRGDGVTQSVAAAHALVDGRNPYEIDYAATPFSSFTSPRGDGYRNQAHDHYAYPPLAFLIYAPQALVERWTGMTIDAETLYLFIFIFLVGGLVWLGRDWTTRTRLLILTAGNPFVWGYAFVGYNDFLFLLALIGSCLALERRHWRTAGVVFGLALAAKQTSWLLVPLWAWWMWYEYRRGKVSSEASRSILIGAAVTVAITILPFAIWNFGAMFDDIVRYVAGAYPNSFPIANVTLAQYLHVFGIIDDPWSTTPLWPLVLAALVPTAWFVVRTIKRRPTPATLLFGSATILLVAALVNRVGSENYFLPPIILMLAAYAYERRTDHHTT